MLLDGGADPNAAEGCAIQIANKYADVEMFQLLLKHGGREPSTVPDPPQPKQPAAPLSLVASGLAELLNPSDPAESGPPLAKTRCRLGIIADDANVIAADLLHARLSGQTSLELVERQELQRLLAEQKLTRQFASAKANYGQVATLLRADALLLIQTRPIDGTKAVEAQFIRVHPGIVLDTIYSGAPLADAPRWAEDLSRRIPGLAAKAIRRDAVALSVLNVHASVSTPAARKLEQTMNILLLDRLVHDSRFIVLERAHMDKLGFESAGEKPFWREATSWIHSSIPRWITAAALR